jgi:lysophospholipid acyltransferase (LPLAT)-like uncharacterized protein
MLDVRCSTFIFQFVHLLTRSFFLEVVLPGPKKQLLRWYDPILLLVIPSLAALVLKLLMRSCRLIKVEGEERMEEAVSRAGGGGIFASWHQRMSYNFHTLGKRHITVMISQSRDGEYTSRMAKFLGFKSVRGSSTRGGSRALIEIIRSMKKGAAAGMLADGPQGPARVAKMGSVVMAGKAGVPIIPILFGAERAWMFNSWDRYLVPKPFSRVVLLYEEPVWVPPDADGAELEKCRALFEERLNRGARWCDEQFGEERPWRKVKHPGDPEIGPLPEGG